jgi:hypothetical protein
LFDEAHRRIAEALELFRQKGNAAAVARASSRLGAEIPASRIA